MGKAKCRICLAEDVRMHLIANTYLQDTYEKLTTVPLVTKDNRPLQVCYICCARLRNCHLLRTRCHQSEEFFTQLLENSCLNVTPMKDTNILKICQILKISIKSESPEMIGATLKTEPVEIDSDMQVKTEPTEVSEDGTDQDVCSVYTKVEDINITDDVSSEHNYMLFDDPLQVTENLFEDEIESKYSVPATEPQDDDLRELNMNMKDNLKSAHSSRSKETINNICTKAVKIVLNRVDLDHIRTSATADRNQELAEYKEANKSTLSDKPETNVKFEENENTCYQVQTINNSIIEKYNKSKNSSKCNARPFKCETCGKCFSQKYSLKRHLQIHIGEKTYKCEQCEESFICLDYLYKHKYVHRGGKPYKCDLCDKSYIFQRNLREHTCRHTGVKPYKCDICQKCFRKKYILRGHMRLHTGEKPYKCDLCQKSFHQKDILKGHMYLHTGEKPYKCDICQKRFRQNHVLRGHMLLHSGEKPYKCDKCDKRFRVKQGLRKHSLVHTGEKPYKCDICQKRFRQYHVLRGHMLLHTGEKPYKCDKCDKRFRAKQTLKKHSLVHTGEKLYKCDKCDKRFKHKQSLNFHIDMHNGKNKYICDICQKCYSRKHNLVDHIFLHTGERPYKCDICQIHFQKMSTLRDHVCLKLMKDYINVINVSKDLD